jgi:hypothetical protein
VVDFFLVPGRLRTLARPWQSHLFAENSFC